VPRKSNINWRDSDAEKLEREVRRFNAKIYRSRHRHPEDADALPDTIKKADKLQMVEEFKTAPRSEFNKYLNSLDRFLDRGAEKVIENEKGVKITKWKKKEIGIQTATANREKAREREMFDVEVPEGKSTGDIKYNSLRPKEFNFDNIKSKKELDMFEKAVKKQSKANYLPDKMDEYKKNYLETIEINLGQEGQEFYNFISNVPAGDLYAGYFVDDPVLKIQFGSDPLPARTIVYEASKGWEAQLGAHNYKMYGGIIFDE
jgi:hypothetical protein